jgi:hypothetical protein
MCVSLFGGEQLDSLGAAIPHQPCIPAPLEDGAVGVDAIGFADPLTTVFGSDGFYGEFDFKVPEVLFNVSPVETRSLSEPFVTDRDKSGFGGFRVGSGPECIVDSLLAEGVPILCSPCGIDTVVPPENRSPMLFA